MSVSAESHSVPSEENIEEEELAEPSSLPQTPKCLNCGHPAEKHFCTHCGQENEDRNVALKLLIADLLADVISFDSKLFRNMVPLLFRPGFLTNEYNAGRRVRYLAPLKLYLTLSVLFFLVFPWKHPDALNPKVDFANGKSSSHHGEVVIGNANIHKYDFSTMTMSQYDALQRDPKKRDSRTEQFFIRHALKVRTNPAALIQGFFDDIPKMMFLLLPLFAGLFKLVYLRSHRLYVEHLIFLLHCHAVAFLGMTIMLLVPVGWPDVVLVAGLVLYLLVALKTVYKQSWIKTFVKFSLLAFNYVFLLTFFMIATMLIAMILV